MPLSKDRKALRAPPAAPLTSAPTEPRAQFSCSEIPQRGTAPPELVSLLWKRTKAREPALPREDSHLPPRALPTGSSQGLALLKCLKITFSISNLIM